MSIKVWRIVNRRYINHAFSGQGASLYGSRWNSQGIEVVYTAESLSLALLAMLPNININQLSSNCMSICAEIPDDVAIERIDRERLPSDWRSPVYSATKAIGDEWITANKTAVLCIPSAIVPSENLYLINPNHPDFSKIIIHPPEVLSIDVAYLTI